MQEVSRSCTVSANAGKIVLVYLAYPNHFQNSKSILSTQSALFQVSDLSLTELLSDFERLAKPGCLAITGQQHAG